MLLLIYLKKYIIVYEHFRHFNGIRQGLTRFTIIQTEQKYLHSFNFSIIKSCLVD